LESRLKRELVEYSQRAGSEGWCPGTLGNISVLNGEIGRVYIKRSGADLKSLQIEDVLSLDVKGKVVEGTGKPSMETDFHVGIYGVRKDVRAVFHVHPPFATAYAVAGVDLPLVTEAAKILLVDVPLLAKAVAGSTDLARNVTVGFTNPRAKAVLLRDHGIVALGETLEGAFNIASLVEDTAKVAFLSSLLRR
jgi:L-ribulose-5-phosphate 4-epimerase